jgi:hypothetical protein
MSDGGAPLPPKLRAQFGHRLGTDLSTVRVHTGPIAADLTSDFRADALTYGRDVFVNPGAWNPQSGASNRLLAHELAHTTQGGDRVYLKRKREPEAYTDDPGSLDEVKEAVGWGDAIAARDAARQVMNRGLAPALEGTDDGSEFRRMLRFLDTTSTDADDRNVRAAATFSLRRVTGTRAPDHKRLENKAPARYYELSDNELGHPGNSMSPTYVPDTEHAVAPVTPKGQAKTGLSLEELRFRHFKDAFNAALARSNLRGKGLEAEVFHDLFRVQSIVNRDGVFDAPPLTDAEHAELTVLFGNASFVSVAFTLNPGNLESKRYLPVNGRFMCNSYLTDFAELHPQKPYIPKKFWNSPTHIGTTYEAADEISLYPNENRVTPLAPPGLLDWFEGPGEDHFGWVRIAGSDNAETVKLAHDEVSKGKFVAFVAKKKRKVSNQGHSGVYAPDGPGRDQQFRTRAKDIDPKTNEPRIIPAGDRFPRSQAGGIQITHGRRGADFDSDDTHSAPTNVFVGHEQTGFWWYNKSADDTDGKPAVMVDP